MPTYKIKVTVKHKEMHLEVDYGLTARVSPYLQGLQRGAAAQVKATSGSWRESAHASRSQRGDRHADVALGRRGRSKGHDTIALVRRPA